MANNSKDPALNTDYSGAGFGGSLDFGKKPALLHIDFARAYIDKTCSLYAGVEESAEAAKEVLAVARAAGILIVHTRVEFVPGGIDGGVWRPGLQTDRCIQFIKSRKAGDAPFCMVQGYYPPHDPYTAPKEYFAHYRDKGVPFAGYYASVTAIDHEVGRILDALERNGQRHNKIGRAHV